MSRIPALAGPLLLAWLLCAGAVHAQDTDTLDVSGSHYSAQGTFEHIWPALKPPGSVYAAMGLAYSRNPLVLEYQSGEIHQVVSGQFSTRLAAGRTFGRQFRLDLDVPVYPSVMVEGDSHLAMGDIRVVGVIPMRPISRALELAFAPRLTLPTAGSQAYLGNGGLGMALTTALGGTLGRLGWVANLGLDLQKTAQLESTDQVTGSGVEMGAGLHYDLSDFFLVGTEVDGRITLANGLGGYEENPFECHLYGLHGFPNGLQLSAALGTGLVEGMGAPSYRVFLAISYRSPDVIDTDGDGIPDFKDSCPHQAEDFDGFQDQDGCPDPDNDADGVPDTSDDCPDIPGPANAGGCPDRDGDRVPDFRDACPDQPADPRIDPARSDGCPKRVFVSREKIEILEKIFFDVDRATIKEISFQLLHEVANVLNDNPDIRLVEVQGHTDSTASDDYNLQLSQDRAEAVVSFLIHSGGVDPDRLEARGYGETRPIDTNLTEEGRARNRRVEFVIIEQ